MGEMAFLGFFVLRKGKVLPCLEVGVSCKGNA